MSEIMAVSSQKMRQLDNIWSFWAHLPHDTNWTLSSYKKIDSVDSVEKTIGIVKQFSPDIVQNCMLFVMKEDITPMWEDSKNRQGGCFSYKIPNNIIYNTWNNTIYSLVGNTLSTNEDFIKTINGITLSPKKNFCIIKIWVNSCKYQSASLITLPALPSKGCLFKKHAPEF